LDIMNADLIKSILSVAAASIPLIIVIITLWKSRTHKTSELNDSPSLKMLKIKRYPVAEKYWKQYRFWKIAPSSAFSIITIVAYSALIVSNVGQSIIFYIIIAISFSFLVIIFSSFISKSLAYHYFYATKNSHHGRFFLFKNVDIEIEADYYYLFNKCHEALKSLNFQVVEIDTNAGYLEASISNVSRTKDAGLIKVKITHQNNSRNIYMINLDVQFFESMPAVDKLSKYSKLANRFTNQLISKPKKAEVS